MVQEIINNCKIEGRTVYLPPQQLDRAVYTEVARQLNKIGGKWKGGKIQGFVFDHDPAPLLADLQNGVSRNLKKEFQFFETPADLAKRLIDLAEIEQRHLILEPSAGKGAIVRHVPYYENNFVYCYEINELFHEHIAEVGGRVIGKDFLKADNFRKYDRIIANPPFSKNQDIDHIRHMYSTLREGGILVSIASTHWQIATGKKETDFRDWLESLNADVLEIEAGAFKESGTNIPTVIIRIRKGD